MRYYYRDSLLAAYMAKYHKMEFIRIENPSHRADYIQLLHFALGNPTAGLGWSASNSRYYVHPDCHELLKPRVGDLMTNLGLRGWRLQGIRKNGELIFHDEKGSEILGLAPEMEIIQRDEKAWFAPEVEA